MGPKIEPLEQPLDLLTVDLVNARFGIHPRPSKTPLLESLVP